PIIVYTPSSHQHHILMTSILPAGTQQHLPDTPAPFQYKTCQANSAFPAFTSSPFPCSSSDADPAKPLSIAESANKFSSSTSARNPKASTRTSSPASVPSMSFAVCWKVSFPRDRKSTRLNSSHVKISYAVFCLKKKNKHNN